MDRNSKIVNVRILHSQFSNPLNSLINSPFLRTINYELPTNFSTSGNPKKLTNFKQISVTQRPLIVLCSACYAPSAVIARSCATWQSSINIHRPQKLPDMQTCRMAQLVPYARAAHAVSITKLFTFQSFMYIMSK